MSDTIKRRLGPLFWLAVAWLVIISLLALLAPWLPIKDPDAYYLIGSVVGPHPYPDLVARFQAVISEEIRAQLAQKTGSELPRAVVACVGGGSNAAGAFYHFLDEPSVELIAVEAAGLGVDSAHTAATSAVGSPGVLHGSLSLLMQDADGQITEPWSVSAGLDYPGIGPLHAHLIRSGRARAIAVTDEQALQAALDLARSEGIIPALETAHALAVLDRLDLAPGSEVVINLSGRGDKDMETYARWMQGESLLPHGAAGQGSSGPSPTQANPI